MVTEVWSRDGDSGVHTVLRGDCVERKNTGQEWSQARVVPLRLLIPQGAPYQSWAHQETKTGLTHLLVCSWLKAVPSWVLGLGTTFPMRAFHSWSGGFCREEGNISDGWC